MFAKFVPNGFTQTAPALDEVTLEDSEGLEGVVLR